MLKLKNINNYIFFFFLFIFTFLIHTNNLLDGDEGIILEGAWNLYNNKEIYIDFFEFVSPGSFYLIFFVWKIFGPSYLTAKILSIITIFLCSIGIYKISNRIIKSNYAKIAQFIFIISSIIFSTISYHVFNLCLIVWATYFFIIALEEQSKKNIIISGLLTGLSIIFLQNRGIYFLFALSSYLLILYIYQKKYIWMKLNILYTSFSLFVVSLLFIKWNPLLLYEKLILFPLNNYSEVNQNPYFLLAFFFLFLVFNVWIIRKNNSKKIWFLLYLQCILLLSTTSKPNYVHIILVLFPFFSLFGLIINTIKKQHKTYRILSYGYISLIIFFIFVPIFIFFTTYPSFSLFRKTAIVEYIKDNCKKSKFIYAGPFLPNLYLETKKMNSTPFSWLITNHHTKKQFEEAKSYLIKNAPECAILKYNNVRKFKYNSNNPVDNYIKDNYNFIKKIQGFSIYKINKN